MDRNARTNDFLREPTAITKQPYHPYNPDNGGRLDNVHGVIAIALPKGRTLSGKDLVYPPSAQGFRDFSTDSHYGEQARIMFQCMLEIVQMKQMGTAWLNLPQGHRKEAEYVAALCRKQLNSRKKGDKEKYDARFGAGFTFDKELSKTLCEALRTGYAPQVDGDGEGDDEPLDGIELGDDDSSSASEQEVEDLFQDEEEEEEGGQGYNEEELLAGLDAFGEELEAVEEQVLANQAEAMDENEDEAEDEDEAEVLEMDEGEDENMDMDDFMALSISADDEEVVDQVIPAPHPIDQPPGRRARAAHNHAIADRAADHLLNGVLREKIEEKMKMIQVFFTNDRGEDVGSVAFFFQMDPLFNVGEGLQKIVTAHGEREAAKVENAIGQRKKGYMSFQEPFPHVVGDKRHAVNRLDKDLYTGIASSYSGDVSLLSDRENVLRNDDVWNITDVNCGDSPNPYHPLSVFTPGRALDYMRAAGAQAAQCDLDFFMVDGAYDEDRAINGQSWRVPPQRSYWIRSQAAFWKKFNAIGLSGLCFPNISMPKAHHNALVTRPTEFDLQMQGDYFENYFEEGTGVVSLVQKIDWDPFAKNKLDHVQQLSIENLALLKDMPKNPEIRGAEFNVFSEAMDAFKLNAVAKACQIFKVGNTNISKPLQAIETWVHDENIRKVSTYVPHSMPDMDTISNVIIRDAMMSKHYRHVAEEQRWWILCHYGLMDCYHYDHEVHLNLIFAGMSQTGKSYFLFDATTKTWIPGTVYDILESSNRADNTDDQVKDTCIAMDEIKREIVDGKAAERDRTGYVERMKAKLTGCRLTYKVLTLRQDHTGRTERIAEWIETDHVATMAAATNKQVKVSGDEALASRFGKFTICRPTCDVFEYMGIKNKLSSKDKAIKKGQVKHLRIVQMLSAKIQKLIEGAVIGQPSMEVFNVMFARMLAFLKEQGVDVSEQRQIQLMERFAYQLVIRKACYDLYMRPGAPLFGRIFDLKDMIAHGDWVDKVKSEDCLRIYQNAKRHYKKAAKLIERNEQIVEDCNAELKDETLDRAQIKVISTRLDKASREVVRLNKVASKHYDTMNTAFSNMSGSPGIEPYLYCTKQIAIFTFTLMGEMLIDPVTKVVLDAMCKFAGFKHKPGDDSEMVFRRDRANEAPWKEVLTPTDDVDDQGVRKVHIDFNINYFEMQGLPKEIAGHVSQYTEPKVSPEDCVSYMGGLKRKFIRAYKHRLVSKSIVDTLEATGGQANRANFPLPKEDTSTIIPILQYDYKLKRTYVAVEALERYNVDLLQQAVLFCLYDGWRDGQTFLFGLPIEGYTEVFSTIQINRSNKPIAPMMDHSGEFMMNKLPVFDKQGRERLNYAMCVDKHKRLITKEEPMLDEEGEQYYSDVQVGNELVRKLATRTLSRIQFPELDPKTDEVMYDEETGDLIVEYGVLVEEPIVSREAAGLLDVYSMGEAFTVPEIAYIDDVASDLLCRVPWDPDSDDKVFGSDECDRKIAVVEITEDLDDWGLEKHLLRQGLNGVLLKEIAKQAHIMDFVAAHVKYDTDYRAVYINDDKDSLDLNNYPTNIIAAIDKRKAKMKKARDFERAQRNAKLEAARRASSSSHKDFSWTDFVSGSRTLGTQKRKANAPLNYRRKPAPQNRAPRPQPRKRKKKKKKKSVAAAPQHKKKRAEFSQMDAEATRSADHSGGDLIQIEALDEGTVDSLMSSSFV